MTTTLRFRCYFCHRVHSVPDGAAGKRGRCVCGKLMLVPSVPAGEGSSMKSIPLALPPAVQPPGGADDAADIDFALRSAATVAGPVEASGEEPTRPLGMPSRDTERLAPLRPEEPKGGSRLLGTVYVILSLVAFAAWVLHQFFSGANPAGGRLLWASDPNLAGLPAAFWSTVFLSLGLALLLEGFYRIKRA